MNDLEQYIRAGITTTGLETKHRSYARATVPETAGEDAPPEELQTLEDQVLAFLSNKNIMIEKKHISACHTLSNQDKVKPTIVVQFSKLKHKVEVLKQARKLKGTGVYINEHLTKKNAEIARQSRILRTTIDHIVLQQKLAIRHK